MRNDYFCLQVYGNGWQEIAERSNLVFHNKGGIIKSGECLTFLVFAFVANYNLSDLELFFELAGFECYPIEENPDPSHTLNITLPNMNKAHFGLFGGYDTKVDALAFIKEKFGNNIIEIYEDYKITSQNSNKVKSLHI